MTAHRAQYDLRNRVRMVQSVDRMIGKIRRTVGPDTYVVVTSDNGYHLGQHQLNGGKGTPYDSDTRVPFIVVGPDVVPGPRSQVISNVDLAPTFERLAGLTPLPSAPAGRSTGSCMIRGLLGRSSRSSSTCTPSTGWDRTPRRAATAPPD